MNSTNKKITLVFDYDGTIQETMRIYKPAVLETAEWLRAQGICLENPTNEKIESWLGETNEKMWSEFAPALPLDIKEQGMLMVGAKMREIVENGAKTWFDGAISTFDLLKNRGYSMIVLSNCDRQYADFNFSHFNMKKWFLAFYDCEISGWMPKSEVLSSIMHENQEMAYIMIGDRANDMEAAIKNRIPFIACDYGYAPSGELHTVTARAKSISELPSLLEKLNEL